MAEKKTKATPTKAASKKATPKKAPAVRTAIAPVLKAAPEAASSGGACPRCGTTTFAPEQRTRVDGIRTVRFTILVCERGHTFARAVTR